ncbi:division/cell wall cluster transcriptional repressor MraZ [uncultured Castellaniella sp.]|uniref:division/cell wall cluster transcriptional repressor MraZ n=1 Tax=uncultured Castellaniella sp. TaxID=647907 RepID=UPI002631198F|nr:division/cell wall cluster transcriptional repressor MraZ [uncultured Castellaniella sp.]
MFQGSSALTLDAKGRMSIPARYRDALQSDEQGCLTLTRHPDGCLMLYPRSTWETKRAQIAALPAVARPLQRLLLGSAQDVDMDGAGRILVAPELRDAAGLAREVMLLGLGSHFELWDREQWEARSLQDVSQLDPAILEQISF